MMREKNKLILRGCHPVPISSYLKALGILRVISKQKEPDVEGYWNDEDNFVLVSSMTGDELSDFFLNAYSPSPICDPWNGGSGFYKGEDKKTGMRTKPTKDTIVVDAISGSKAERLTPLRNALLMTTSIVQGLGYTSAPSGDIKMAFMSSLRASMPDEALEWIDAAVVLGDNKPGYPAILGSGGNDGRLDFCSNFFQRLRDVFSLDTGESSPSSEIWLKSALDGEIVTGLVRDVAIGQFNPGMSGGLNSSTGFKDKSIVNPWEYILMIEGALVFASAAVRRFDTEGASTISSPFSVKPNRAAYSGKSESEKIRAEIWFPLWRAAAGYEEISYLFSEGRATVKGKKAKDSLSIAVAVATMGVDRGITDFERYSFIERNGNAHFAIPLGRFDVRNDPDADILEDIHHWLSVVRRASAEGPGSVQSAAGKLEEMMIQFCRTGGKIALQRLLAQAGNCERALINSGLWQSPKGIYTRPVLLTDPRWLQNTYDGSVEFRLAASLASCRIEQFGSIRKFCEPVAFKGKYPSFDKESRLYEKRGESIVDVLGSLMQKILMTTGRKEIHSYPVYGKVYASPEDISSFISGSVSDRKLMELFNGFILLDWKSIDGQIPWEADSNSLIPGTWAVLKLVHSPFKLKEKCFSVDPSIHRLAFSGKLNRAMERASRRLSGEGCPTVVNSAGGSAGISRRMAAALLFPVSKWTMTRLFKMVTNSEVTEEGK